jgi:hypothetical protein
VRLGVCADWSRDSEKVSDSSKVAQLERDKDGIQNAFVSFNSTGFACHL